jgi:predicted DNA-binding transcriptional regulator AlpA
MDDLIDIHEMGARLNVRPEYVRDRLVKRPDFPRPAISLSQKCRRWSRDAFDDWLRKEQKKQAR